MYKRRFSNRTPKFNSAPRVSTSTPKSTVEPESDRSRVSFPMSGISPQKRKENEIESQTVTENAKKIKSSSSSSYFEKVVSTSGYIFKEGENPHVLTRDQAIFVRDVTSELKNSPLFPKNVDDFFAGFEKYCSKNSDLKMLLTHTKTSPDCNDARGGVQESLVRLLLSVDPVQSKILQFLLEKVGEFALTGDTDADSDDVPWVRIILRQMRLLDNIVDGSSLNDHLFSVLEVAPLAVQREMIFCLPDIISDEHHHDAALRLSKLLRTNFELTAAVMEALDCLSLENTLRSEVCEHMLHVLNRASPEFLPAIITFLVSSQGQDEHLLEVITGLREKLDFSPAGGLDGSNQMLILSALLPGALRCRKLVDIWLRAISSTHSSSHLTLLDMAVLLLFHHWLPGRKKIIQNILRNRIKAGVITEALIEKMFTTLLAPIKEYMKTALHIATVLFKSPDPPVQYIGKVWFKLMLTHLKGHVSQSVIMELLLLIGTGGVAIATSALGIMSEVEPRHLQSHVVLLMGLLDNIHDMDLIQVGRVMDLLCSLVYGEEAESMHHDEIHMMIRKHLSSSSYKLKQKGVVGAVMALKHMATSESESEVDNMSNSSIDSSNLTGRAGRAKELLDLVMESIQNNVLCLGLLYDQLAAAVCTCSSIDITFLRWITDKTIDKFQDHYVKELKQVAGEGCPQFSLESPDEEDEEAICLDIEGVSKLERSQQDGSGTGHPLCVMAPLFRLLRSLQFRISNNLESVDALLGCPIGMPKDLEDLIDDFRGLSQDEQLLVLDSLFYCINWFRELINAFSLLRDKELQTKVLLRIENCIMLQKLLATALRYARKLDYKPPCCHFYTDITQALSEKPRKVEKKAGKGKGKGKGKKKDAASTSVANLNATVAADDPASLGNEMSRNVYRCYFRELDMEVSTMLSKPFVLNKKDIQNDEPALHPGILLFLLEDYIAKLDHCLPNTVKRISSLATSQHAATVASIGFANLDRIAVSLIARRAVKLLPYIMKMLETAAQYCQELLDENDGIYDGPDMFKDGSAEIKLCYGMLLHAVATTVGWSGFHSTAYTNLLRDCLRVIASRQNTEHKTVNSIKILVLSSCEYFVGYASRTVHLTSAENLVRVIQVLIGFVPSEAEPKKKLADICHGFLSRQWHTLEGLPESGAVYNRQVESLVKTYFTNVPDQLKVVESTAKWVESEIKQLKNKDSALATFPTITKANFPILYRNLWYALESAINKALESAGARSGAKFKIWISAANVMAVLTNIIKQIEHRASHQAYIKQSQVILRDFLSDGMPVLETLLRSKREDVPGLLKVLQITTRYLHALCVSTKRENMSGLTAHVPVVRKNLETLIFRVKAMLVANNCTEAFWMGNLKNKTIRGDEILSQDTTASEEQNNEDEDELPEDEHSDADLDNDTSKKDGDEENDDDDESISEIL